MALALEGIKVLDVSQVAAVPMCARHLADFGADVIHIENPATGDSWRVFQAGVSGTGTGSGAPSEINYNWENFNRNKKSVTIDLSHEGGRDIVYRMVEKADVFVTNLRLWEREKFGLEYDTLSRLNPRLIYGSLTGWGKQGPDKNAPAYDSLAYWARAGLGYLYTVTGMSPAVDGGAFGDNVAALGLAFGIMTALYVRERTGVGQEVDTSLFHTGIYQISFFIAGALTTGLDLADWRVPAEGEERMKRREELLTELAAAARPIRDFFRESAPNPLVLPYETKDDRWLLLSILQPDRYWAKVCQAIERADIEHDPRFESFEPRVENHVALLHILDETFRSKTLDEWKPRLAQAGIPFAPYQNFLETVNDPQAKANDFFIPVDHPSYGRIEVISNPVSLSKTPSSIRMPAPEFSQHTEEVLLEYGYTWEDIGQFKEQGIIA